MYTLIKINYNDNHQLVNLFLKDAGDSLTTFRYYVKRSLDVIQNHLYTILIKTVESDKYIGYGHLDNDEGKIWLGICVSANYTGKGIGKLILSNLISWAGKHQVYDIYLSVDDNNKAAKNLYLKFGFVFERSVNEISYYHLCVNKMIS